MLVGPHPLGWEVQSRPAPCPTGYTPFQSRCWDVLPTERTALLLPLPRPGQDTCLHQPITFLPKAEGSFAQQSTLLQHLGLTSQGQASGVRRAPASPFFCSRADPWRAPHARPAARGDTGKAEKRSQTPDGKPGPGRLELMPGRDPEVTVVSAHSAIVLCHGGPRPPKQGPPQPASLVKQAERFVISSRGS